MKLTQPVWPRFLPSEVVVNCATLGPVGRARRAPGTWGALAGMVYQLLLFHSLSLQPLGALWVVLASLPGLWLAVCLCGEAEFRLGKRDPGEVILDEFTVMPLCFIGWPWMVGPLPIWGVMLAGFALFRLYDITKPFGIKRLQDLPGGWGVVADDVAAALATCATMHIAQFSWHAWK